MSKQAVDSARRSAEDHLAIAGISEGLKQLIRPIEASTISRHSTENSFGLAAMSRETLTDVAGE